MKYRLQIQGSRLQIKETVDGETEGMMPFVFGNTTAVEEFKWIDLNRKL